MRIRVWLLLGTLLASFSSLACTLTMGYRTNERVPLIAASPSNDGLYMDFYSLVVEKLGCELKVIRGPKNRILKQLKDGEIDFYPGFNFNESRAQYTYYIDNGFPGGEAGISRQDFPTITDLSQLEGSTVLQALGSPNFVRNLEAVEIYAVPEMTIEKAVGLLRKRRGDFYIYNHASLSYYLKRHNDKDIKVHPECCGGVQPLYLGFSRRSEHYQEQANPNYLPDQELSPENFPVQLKQGTKAYQLQQLLQQMKQSGETDNIYHQYY